MNRVFILSLLLVFALVSCGNKTDAKKVGAGDHNVETAASEKPKSKYETRKALERNFKREQGQGFEQVLAKNVQDTDGGIYCYFLEKNARIISLSLFIKYSQYNVDTFELKVGDESLKFEVNRKRDVESNGKFVDKVYHQWHEKMLNEESERLLRKAGETGKASLLVKSKENTLATIDLTKEQCTTMLNTIDYYISLNGAKIPKKGMVNIRSF